MTSPMPIDAGRDELVTVIRSAIEQIAPEIDATTIPTDVDVREEAELDSMDFLAVLTSIEERTGVSIPERDYADVATLDDLVAYVVEHRDR